MQKTTWIYSHASGVFKFFWLVYPYKYGYQSGKPAISSIYGVVSKKKKVPSPGNLKFYASWHDLQKKFFFNLPTSQIVDIDKRSNLKKYFC